MRKQHLFRPVTYPRYSVWFSMGRAYVKMQRKPGGKWEDIENDNLYASAEDAIQHSVEHYLENSIEWDFGYEVESVTVKLKRKAR